MLRKKHHFCNIFFYYESGVFLCYERRRTHKNDCFNNLEWYNENYTKLIEENK
jgi:hypothetical protein